MARDRRRIAATRQHIILRQLIPTAYCFARTNPEPSGPIFARGEVLPAERSIFYCEGSRFGDLP